MSTNRRLQKAARDLMGQTGMKYTEALRQTQDKAPDRSPTIPEHLSGPFTWHLPEGVTLDHLLRRASGFPDDLMGRESGFPAVQYIEGSPGCGASMLARALAQWQHARGVAQIIVTTEALGVGPSGPADYGFDPDKVTHLQLGAEGLRINYTQDLVLVMASSAITGADEFYGSMARLYAEQAISRASSYTSEALLEALNALECSGLTERSAREFASKALREVGAVVERTQGEGIVLPEFQDGHVLVILLPTSESLRGALDAILHSLLTTVSRSQWSKAVITVDDAFRYPYTTMWCKRMSRSLGLSVRLRGATEPTMNTWVGREVSPARSRQWEQLAHSRGASVDVQSLPRGYFYFFPEQGAPVGVRLDYRP